MRKSSSKSFAKILERLQTRLRSLVPIKMPQSLPLNSYPPSHLQKHFRFIFKQWMSPHFLRQESRDFPLAWAVAQMPNVWVSSMTLIGTLDARLRFWGRWLKAGCVSQLDLSLLSHLLRAGRSAEKQRSKTGKCQQSNPQQPRAGRRRMEVGERRGSRWQADAMSLIFGCWPN